MMMRFITALAAALFAAACSSGTMVLAQEAGGSAESEAKVVSPEEYLGHPVGADFKLPGWEEISGYYRELAKASPNVLLESVGRTTEGRDFLVAIISSAENLARLDEIRGRGGGAPVRFPAALPLVVAPGVSSVVSCAAA